MEENKKVTEQKAPLQGDRNGGGRHRRHKHKGGGQNSSAQNAQAQQVQKQPNQQGQKQGQKQPNQQGQKQQNNQNSQKPKGNVPQQKNQNTQNPPQGQNAQNQGGKKNKNKQGKPQQAQNPQNNAQNQSKNENRKDTYLYALDGNLYVNLTNKCSNGCDFCVRNERSSYYGNYLWLRNGDPTVEQVISAAKGYGDLTRFKEVVFCGFGEPTYKVAEMVALCDYFHEKGLKTRLNTNGQGNLINKRDIVPELKGKIDFVNVSLNASCAEKYQPICRSQFKEAGFTGLIEFAKGCAKNGIACRFSIVDCIGEEEVENCKRLADSVRIPLYVRKYIIDS